ncbi:BglG family transcription antiterminator [Caldibacillus debilis]|uniref:BglG family transcription antiterminator n=1 Tax=Caldibacillus debilis TaxID=301148 RepID=UPI0023F23489|nr:BglG family transcription antiterminator [Caldibacillus debilis]
MKTLTEREKLILSLLKRGKTYQTGNSISLLIGVSPRTIRNDIKTLNRVLKDYGAKIISKRGMGYKLEIRNYTKFSEIDAQIFDNGNYLTYSSIEKARLLKFIIKTILVHNFVNKKLFLQDLADELFISLTTVKNYLPSVNKELKKFDLRIKIDRFNGIRIEGDEDKFRNCIFENIFRDNNYVLQHLLPVDEMEKIKEIITNILLKHNLILTDIAINNLIIYIEISIQRSLANKHIQFSEEEKKELRSTPEFVISKEIIKEIKNKLGKNIDNEIYYFTQHLVSSGKLIFSQINSFEFNRINSIINKIIEEIKLETSIDFTKDVELRNYLAIHLHVALNRLKYKMTIRNDLLNQIKYHYPLAFELAVIACKKIKEITNFSINEDEIGYIAIHFGAALERKGINEKSKVKKILIVCGSGLATASLIRERIKRFFGDQINIIETTSLLKLNVEMINKVDLVLTTVPINNLTSNKVMLINSILSNKDLEEIKISLYGDKRNRDIDLKKIFIKELFIKGVEFQTKYEILEFMTNLMEKYGYIDEKTKESIFEREKMASTELGELVAIPHALENNMNKEAIAVCILKNPIIWDKEKVQVVFVLSIPKNKAERYEYVFHLLYKFLIEDFGASKLIFEFNYDDLINSLEKMSRIGWQ